MIRPKLAAAVALAGAGALMLTACGRSDTPADGATAAAALANGPATGTLTIWAQGTEGEALQNFLAPFEEANPDLDVQVTAVPWDSAQNKYQTAVAGGTTPDIGMIGTDWMPTFVDALQPTPDGIDTSGMFPGAVQTTEFDGVHYGVPWYVETRAIFYRSDLLAQAGFDAFPTDQAGLRDLAQAYVDKAGAEYGISLPVSGWNSFLGILPFAWSADADVLNSNQDAWTFDTPQMQAAMDFTTGLFADGLADSSPDAEAGSTTANFVDGSVPMFISGPWDIPGLKTAGGEGFEDQFDVAPIPAADGGTSTSLMAGSNLEVFTNARNPDAAWKLIEWLTDPEVQVDWFQAVNDLPSQQAAWDDPALTADPKVAAFGTQLESGRILPTAPTWTQVSAAADTEWEQMVRGGVSVTDGLAELQATAESLGIGR